MDTNKINLVNLHSHPSYVAYLAIFILSVFSVFFGFLIKDSLVGPDLGVTPYYLGDSAEIVNLVTRAEFLPVWLKMLIFSSSVFGFIFYELVNLGLFSTAFRPSVNKNMVYNFLANRWYVDSFYSYLVGLFNRASRLHIIIAINNSTIDSDFVEVIVSNLKKNSQTVDKLSTFSIAGYFISFLRGVILLGFIFFGIVSPVDAILFFEES